MNKTLMCCWLDSRQQQPRRSDWILPPQPPPPVARRWGSARGGIATGLRRVTVSLRSITYGRAWTAVPRAGMSGDAPGTMMFRGSKSRCGGTLEDGSQCNGSSTRAGPRRSSMPVAVRSVNGQRETHSAHAGRCGAAGVGIVRGERALRLLMRFRERSNEVLHS
jgi:hypothetical protein